MTYARLLTRRDHVREGCRFKRGSLLTSPVRAIFRSGLTTEAWGLFTSQLVSRPPPIAGP